MRDFLLAFAATLALTTGAFAETIGRRIHDGHEQSPLREPPAIAHEKVGRRRSGQPALEAEATATTGEQHDGRGGRACRANEDKRLSDSWPRRDRADFLAASVGAASDEGDHGERQRARHDLKRRERATWASKASSSASSRRALQPSNAPMRRAIGSAQSSP